MTAIALAIASLLSTPAMRPDPAVAPCLSVSEAQVTLVALSVSLRCTALTACEVTETYTLRNDTGVPQRAHLETGEPHRATDIVLAPDVSLEPGEEQQVVLTARLQPGSWRYGRLGYGPARTRHMVVGEEFTGDDPYWVELSFGALRSFAAVPETAHLELDTELKAQLTAGNERRPLGDVPLDVEKPLSIELRDPHARRLLNGGPTVAVGVTHRGTFRGRLGYELALPQYLLWSAVAETDARSELVFALAAQLALPSVLIFPSCSIGVGLPVRALPAPRVGVRLEGSLHWPYLGFVTVVDWFPDTAVPVTAAFMLQLGL
jgi:hypothetical protein